MTIGLVLHFDLLTVEKTRIGSGIEFKKTLIGSGIELKKLNNKIVEAA